MDTKLHWVKGIWGAWWAGDGDVSSERVTYAIFNPNPPGFFDLWVWSGPAEQPAGLMGADLRSMDRAENLGQWPNLRAAKQAADRHLSEHPAEIAVVVRIGDQLWKLPSEHADALSRFLDTCFERHG
ncbi:hypothetical protein [Mycobacterium intracellulare]|uniref:hypothetical protein n=1 Tax=Mycobacterium intracellulare TaxID=1767 RepID=UPI001155DC6A|nr:hypothetical protein [Mycobacterium intracellulare]